MVLTCNQNMRIIRGLKSSCIPLFKKPLNTDLNGSTALLKHSNRDVPTLWKQPPPKPYMTPPRRAAAPLHRSPFPVCSSGILWYGMKREIFRSRFCSRTTRRRGTHVAELQRQALAGLQLGRAQVQLGGRRVQLGGAGGALLRDVHLRGQAEVQRAARLLGQADGDRLVAGNLLRALARLEQRLIGVLADIWGDAVKGRQHTHPEAKRSPCAPPSGLAPSAR